MMFLDDIKKINPLVQFDCDRFNDDVYVMVDNIKIIIRISYKKDKWDYYSRSDTQRLLNELEQKGKVTFDDDYETFECHGGKCRRVVEASKEHWCLSCHGEPPYSNIVSSCYFNDLCLLDSITFSCSESE